MKLLICNLIKQYPKPSKPTSGVLTIPNENDEAMFFDKQNECRGTLMRPRLKFTNGIGMFFTGLQPDGFDRKGQQKYTYQEWWCVFDRVEDDGK